MSEKINYYYEMYMLAKNIIGASEEARNCLSEKTCNEIEGLAGQMIAVSEEAQKEYEDMLQSLQADILDKVFEIMELDKKVKQAYKEGYEKGQKDAKAGINLKYIFYKMNLTNAKVLY